MSKQLEFLTWRSALLSLEADLDPTIYFPASQEERDANTRAMLEELDRVADNSVAAPAGQE